tara:strand:+ start:14594 stop:14815 length:222 start_codon:yes stop_codon:yes gene_type:complete
MKIFEVLWYNEDDFGPTEWIRVIAQSSDYSLAERSAKDKLDTKMQEIVETFKNKTVTDISSETILFQEHRIGI